MTVVVVDVFVVVTNWLYMYHIDDYFKDTNWITLFTHVSNRVSVNKNTLCCFI